MEDRDLGLVLQGLAGLFWICGGIVGAVMIAPPWKGDFVVVYMLVTAVVLARAGQNAA